MIRDKYPEESSLRHPAHGEIDLKNFNELENYKTFRKEAKTHARYQHLLYRTPERELEPYTGDDLKVAIKKDPRVLYEH